MEKVSFLQPRHSYAPPEGIGQRHTNTSLWTAVSRVRQAGVDVLQVHDENLRPFEPQSDLVGINLLGAPYIPVVQNRLEKFGGDVRAILGGQVTTGLFRSDAEGHVADRAQFTKLFGDESVVGNNDKELAQAIGIDASSLPHPSATSLIPAYELIGDDDMREYLLREMSFYVSQGCAFGCDFCAAVRTIKDPLTGELRKVKEEYREPDILKGDLAYLASRATRFGIGRLEMYLSNLDLFQTPGKLAEFAGIVSDVVSNAREERPDFGIGMRGLATVSSFMKLHEKQPEVIRAMAKAGLHTVGFGIDGWDEDVWARIHKGHNSKNDSIRTMQLCREEYGITPEVLMVFGHASETPASLEAAYRITEHMVTQYGAVPRPHVSKDLVPGNAYWTQGDERTQERVNALLERPELFQHFDFTAKASAATHPDAMIRDLTNTYFEKMAALPGNTTHVIEPHTDEATRSANLGKFDR